MMKSKKQLQKENELLKAKLLIKEHTKSYIHIPLVGKVLAGSLLSWVV